MCWPAYVLACRCSAHDLGYLVGLLLEPAVGAMVHTYVDHFVLSLISVELDLKLSADPLWSGLYDELAQARGGGGHTGYAPARLLSVFLTARNCFLTPCSR